MACLMVEDTVDDIQPSQQSVSSRVALTRKALNIAEGGEGEINSFSLPSSAPTSERRRRKKILPNIKL